MTSLGIYRHYRGSLYLVTAIARHTENIKPVVVYNSLTGDYKTWVRPLETFQEKVLFDHKPINRFTFVPGTPGETPPDCR